MTHTIPNHQTDHESRERIPVNVQTGCDRQTYRPAYDRKPTGKPDTSRLHVSLRDHRGGRHVG